MKNIKTTVILLLAVVLVFSGCSLFVPEEYKDGVKVDRDYPDDDLPVYEDAIVFSSVEDDGEITLLMGTKDDLDDIVDFYKDFFEDEEIVLTDEDEGKKDYTAEGHIEGFDFELEVTEADDGDWQEKLFAYVIEIVVTPAEEPVIDVVANTTDLLIGSWAMTSVKLAGSDITHNYWEYLICTFNEDGTASDIYKWPNQAESIDRFNWTSDGSNIIITFGDGAISTFTITSLSEDEFIESFPESFDYDTIEYMRVPDDAWRPEYTTPPSDDSTYYYGDPAALEDIYGSWVDYSYESSFAIWPDGTGRLWNTSNPDGWDITWIYDETGWLYLYFGEDAYESYYVSFDGEDIYIQNNEYGIYQYMGRPDYAITYVPWVMMFDSTNANFVYNKNIYVYIYSDNTYEVNDNYSVRETGTWELNSYGDLAMATGNTQYYFFISFEGNWLLLYDGTNSYWYQDQYYVE